MVDCRRLKRPEPSPLETGLLLLWLFRARRTLLPCPHILGDAFHGRSAGAAGSRLVLEPRQSAATHRDRCPPSGPGPKSTSRRVASGPWPAAAASPPGAPRYLGPPDPAATLDPCGRSSWSCSRLRPVWPGTQNQKRRRDRTTKLSHGESQQRGRAATTRWRGRGQSAGAGGGDFDEGGDVLNSY